MKRIKYAFNMVEIMLAIVVITVGLASVFVLFPAGLNAHKTATAENSMADLAELVFANIRTVIDVDLSNGENRADKSTFSDSYWANISAAAPANVDAGLAESESWQKFSVLESSAAAASVSLLQHNSAKNIFWIRQMSGPAGNEYVDFSAIGRVYVDRDGNDSGMEKEFFKSGKNDEFKLYEDVNVEFNVDGSNKDYPIRNYLLPMVLELSYPADKPYADREKSYFRFELFNEYYKPLPKP